MEILLLSMGGGYLCEDIRWKGRLGFRILMVGVCVCGVGARGRFG